MVMKAASISLSCGNGLLSCLGNSQWYLNARLLESCDMLCQEWEIFSARLCIEFVVGGKADVAAAAFACLRTFPFILLLGACLEEYHSRMPGLFLRAKR